MWKLFFVICALLLHVAFCDDFYELLGVTKAATQKEIRQAFKKLALAMHPDKNQDDPKAHEKFVRINRAYEVLKDEELRKKFDMHGEEGLKEGTPSGSGYQSWNFYKQNFGIYDDDPEIITLRQSDFEQSVENSDDIWFVNYYSPQCSHCHELAPTWRQLARELDGVIRIGAINCADDWMLCNNQGIQSYPSLILYPQKEKYFGVRSVIDMTEYALRQVREQVHELWDGNWQEKVTSDELSRSPWLISFCGESGDCLEKATVTKLAAMLGKLVNIGIIDCIANVQTCNSVGISSGTYFFHAGKVGKDAGLEISTLDPKETTFKVLSFMPDVKILDKENFKNALADLQKKTVSSWLIHFVESTELQSLEFRKLPAFLRDFNVGRVDCALMRTECNDLNIHKFPTFALFKSGGGHEIHHGRQTSSDIAAFARDCDQNTVRILSPADFPSPVLDGTTPWFVDFFAPWCPPCMRLLPEFRKASKELTGQVNFGTVDCTVHQNLCNSHGVRSYPTTILYNKTVPHHFHGHHSARDIVEFAQDTLNPSVILLTAESFHQLVAKKPQDEVWMIDFYAPWCGPCQQLSPEWRRLAKTLKTIPQVKVAQVDCDAYSSLCQQQGVTSYPNIRLYPQGNRGASFYHTYSGWFRDAQSLKAWAFEFLPSKVTLIKWATFQQTVLQSTEPWIVDFYAPWCGHCQVFAPEFERVAQALEGKVKFGKVNCQEEQYLCQQARINAYPSVRFYRGTSNPKKAQDLVGEDIQSQNGDEIIRLLKEKTKKKAGRDEL